MATTVADNIGRITFIIGGNTYDVKKSDIKYVNLDRGKGRIDVSVASGHTSGNHIFIVFSDVTSPDENAIGMLYKTLMNWWKEPNKTHALFLAEAGDTAFDVTPRITLDDNSEVEVDGNTDYNWTRSGNVITFTYVMTGYELIKIKQ